MSDRDMGCANMCCGCTCVVLLFCTIPMIYYPVGLILDSEIVDCKITDVQIPTEPPDINLNNWKSCDCGRRCWSYQPCIKIKTNYSNTKILVSSLYNFNNECTFFEDHCPDITNYSILIQESENTYKQYYNQSIECNYNSYANVTFINNDIKYVPLIGASIALFLVMCACCCINAECFENCGQFCHNIFTCNQCITKIKDCIHNNFVVKFIKLCLKKINERRNSSKIEVTNLNQVVIEMQPMEKYKLKKEEINEVCVICLENYEKNKKVIKLKCGHIIHLECWNQWKDQKSNCPVCRAEQ